MTDARLEAIADDLTRALFVCQCGANAQFGSAVHHRDCNGKRRGDGRPIILAALKKATAPYKYLTSSGRLTIDEYEKAGSPNDWHFLERVQMWERDNAEAMELGIALTASQAECAAVKEQLSDALTALIAAGFGSIRDEGGLNQPLYETVAEAIDAMSAECAALAATQCKDPTNDEYGNMVCKALEAAEKDTKRLDWMEQFIAANGDMFIHSADGMGTPFQHYGRGFRSKLDAAMEASK